MQPRRFEKNANIPKLLTRDNRRRVLLATARMVVEGNKRNVGLEQEWRALPRYGIRDIKRFVYSRAQRSLQR
jgi:hypothetical protein